MRRVQQVKTFEQLVRGVQDVVLEARRRIENAAVFTDWETGRLINAHVLLHRPRALRHEGVIGRLAERTGISERVLYYCARFNRIFPYLNPGSNMTSHHYRLLCQIDDLEQRQSLHTAAEKKIWTVRELEARVREFNLLADKESDGSVRENTSAPPATARKTKLLVPKRGTPGFFPIIARRNGLAVDLGFKTYWPVGPEPARRLGLSPGAIVQADEAGVLRPDSSATKASLFTYCAREVRVVDGDTLAVTISLPPPFEIDKKLRLRGLDCPEINTTEGKAAKRFVQTLVEGAASILVTTTKPDKYDRYLADVFIESPGGPALFLNNALLENGHAAALGVDTPEEWAG